LGVLLAYQQLMSCTWVHEVSGSNPGMPIKFHGFDHFPKKSLIYRVSEKELPSYKNTSGRWLFQWKSNNPLELLSILLSFSFVCFL
jgi:hypothetical protein